MIKDFQLLHSGYNSSNEFYHKKKNYYYNYRPIDKLIKKRRMQLNVTGVCLYTLNTYNSFPFSIKGIELYKVS